MAEKRRVAVLVSGRGSNMAALLYASRAADCGYEIVLVASNNPDAPALALAAAEGVPVFAHSHKGLERDAFDAIIEAALVRADAEFVALAGYMRLMSAGFVGRWAGRMVNIHPSLLPAYKGLDTYARALAAGERWSGCTVHVVTPEVDDGPVLAQTRVAVLQGDTPDSLAARILIAEHQLYPRALAAFVTRDRDPDYILTRLRELALALPEADETLSHGMPCFGIAKGKKFAYLTRDHHGDGKTALLVKISGVEEQAMLIEQDPERHYRPAYFGDGWIGIRLDLGDIDWDGIDAWLRRSWTAVAPRKLAALLEF